MLVLDFNTDLILELAQQFWPITYLIIISIGATQGIIIGQAIIDRFPQLQFHTRVTLISLLVIFVTYAIANILRFSDPGKIDIPEVLTSTPQDSVHLILKAVGLNMEIGTIIGFIVTIFVILVTKLTRLQGHSKYYVLTISVLILIVMATVKLSDYNPEAFEILLFVLYNAGLTTGLFWGTRRRLQSREIKHRNFANWWIGRDQP